MEQIQVLETEIISRAFGKERDHNNTSEHSEPGLGQREQDSHPLGRKRRRWWGGSVGPREEQLRERRG